MTELIQLSQHTWMLPPAKRMKDLRPTVGIVCTDDATVLYDAGNSPRHAREVREALKSIDAPPVRFVVYSHFHWDHIFGAQVFENLPETDIISHESSLSGINDYLQYDWTRSGVEVILTTKPWYHVVIDELDAGNDWETFHIVKPTMTFSGTHYTLPVEGLTLELEHVGGKHCHDSVILRVVEDRVMFLSDSFYPKPDGIDRANDQAMVDRFLAERYDKYIDGHRGEVFRVRRDLLDNQKPTPK